MVLTFFELNKITDDVLENWLKKLPKFRQDEVLKYRFRDDRVRSLCAYLLLCVGLGRIVEKFSYNEHGKPSLVDEQLHINLSHAKSAVVAGFSETAIGVDVEFIRKTYPKIVCKRVFTPLEIEQIENAKDPTGTFFKFWTLKESFVKCIGQGLSFPLKTVEFTISNSHPRPCGTPPPAGEMPAPVVEVSDGISPAGGGQGGGIICSDNRFQFSTFTQDGHQISICATEQHLVKNLSFEEFSKLVTIVSQGGACTAPTSTNY